MNVEYCSTVSRPVWRNSPTRVPRGHRSCRDFNFCTASNRSPSENVTNSKCSNDHRTYDVLITAWGMRLNWIQPLIIQGVQPSIFDFQMKMEVEAGGRKLTTYRTVHTDISKSLHHHLQYTTKKKHLKRLDFFPFSPPSLIPLADSFWLRQTFTLYLYFIYIQTHLIMTLSILIFITTTLLSSSLTSALHIEQTRSITPSSNLQSSTFKGWTSWSLQAFKKPVWVLSSSSSSLLQWASLPFFFRKKQAW